MPLDSKRLKQVTNSLKKSLDNWDFKKAIAASKDETQTRDNLIHTFLNHLNYRKIDHYTHEYYADMADKKNRRVDIAITLGKKEPVMLVECKSVTANLTDNHFRQLNEYCLYTPSAKIGIVTNGIIYNFHAVDTKQKKGLNPKPFFAFNLLAYETADIEKLALFNHQNLEIKDILAEAEDIYFLDEFDNAFCQTLSVPSDDLAKLIYKNMGGQRSSDKVLNQIKLLVNSGSIKTALDKVIKKEIAASNSGIITTDEEIKAYNVVKTILAMSSKIKEPQLSRITYRDMKNKFAIIVDENQNKNICSFVFKEKVKTVEINGFRYDLEEVTVATITKLKKELLESALSNLY
ncbi:type I restriction enzyme HsdR N-terminal domain-containing protein [Flavobacterium wongokense]|uniref:type I restriction enzyme HsdR N-terminal domain-containing protein n=1 Tax=Flavobacterium wongokense TaxID=2910674 RepID=UPI001F360640|nr:type I restriction enzyme HsdR N-terminal domain-containing protein [Flavobacterium sp. WG47]MCF6132501.1 type I restriction enzyme HsdR N-terminal domain-containing protein [Flavobacterium sp. WG47]